MLALLCSLVNCERLPIRCNFIEQEFQCITQGESITILEMLNLSHNQLCETQQLLLSNPNVKSPPRYSHIIEIGGGGENMVIEVQKVG